MSTPTLHLGIFYMPQICDMGPTALLPLRRNARWWLFLPLKIRRLRPGLNPRTWVPKASTLPLDHRSRFISKVTIILLRDGISQILVGISSSTTTSPVVSVGSKTRLARLIQSSLQQPLQHGTVVAVFMYVLLLLYLSLNLIPQKSAHYLTFPLDTWQSQKCLFWPAVVTVSLALWVVELSNYSAWNKP